MNAIRVLVVEDSDTFVWGLKATLEAAGEFVVVGVAGSRAEAVAQAEALQPDVAIVDLRIAARPGTAADYRHGLEAITALKAAVPDLHVLAMSFSPQARWPVEAVRAGASGFVSKDVSREELIAAVRTVAQGGVVLTARQLAQVAAAPESPAGLTPRELEVLGLLAEGKSNRQIAQALGIAVGTVRTHVEHLRGKLDVQSRTEAVAEARRRGLV